MGVVLQAHHCGAAAIALEYEVPALNVTQVILATCRCGFKKVVAVQCTPTANKL